MSGPIASAVVLPDLDDSPAPPQPPPPAAAAASPSNALKRRQSSVEPPEDSSIKRARINGNDTSNTANETDPSNKPAAPQRRERGRERRLFGAVLGALSQATPTSGQKRRHEIEKRQLAQRKQEDEESEARKAERLARRRVQRWKEQKRFERQALKTRHDNLFHLAHFLHTKTEPVLYYRPWEMSPEEEDRVEAQIAEARETIARERAEFEAREEEEEAARQRERRASPNAATYGGAPVAGADAAMTTAVDAGDGERRAEVGSEEGANGRGEHAQDHEMQDQGAGERAVEKRADEDVVMDARPAEGEATGEEPGKDADEEEVVEAAEDTVIY